MAKLMKESLILMVSLAFCCLSYAQEASNYASNISEKQEKLDRLKGAYRIESSLRFFTLPSNLADIITENRAAEKTVVKQLSPETTLIIYPYSAISVSTTNKNNKGK